MTIEYATRYRTHSQIPAEPGVPYFIEKGMGDRAHLFGDLFTIYAGGEQTENTFNFFTVEGPKGDIIPAHSHPDTYEVFYITDGAVRLFVEDLQGNQHEKLLTPGDFGFVPKNCPHAYRIERHHSRVVGVAAGPGGTFERFFENLGAPTDELTLPREPVVPAPEKFATVPQQYDVHFMPHHQWRTGS
ncbi:MULTISPECIES: quercetin 2,3-dioxygenase [Streptomyces]|uniref:quercetin 2,3-dioxygenase n=1 Tax=Streptomyces TaxID=1883 RepID=UPI00163CDBB7|nr:MULTISPECIES: quercetin 2,3-dioxygenase [Streptomyces]MBC2879341.1 quercetin 2,3-dioxygenase [Streptomyces sp. TYQ1024]UBI40063.1 quercetin 2,3-dioxygenase [Streptomyces mobaraensis]UKW32643.1 quercetin 2,3-dioxygenase [Streptomyces sp. TYQ1024]